ncbi:unnamed protein product [Bursaphelenchus okinawaensis]|uniref:Reverse transcriptase domain-containing protein n=1 Tax=Bursaphelenchus okinawaensis TaxID=465554 RepID=A0A811JSL9_9BILA|nr:unnamed protein product [Bursaphelenchus okinawaensis]CAG9081798.1 unnamed protein product [Bursaphelenchus okinawaensis]
MRTRKRHCKGKTWASSSDKPNLKDFLEKNRAVIFSSGFEVDVTILFGSKFCSELKSRLPESYDNLLRCSEKLKQRINGFRLGRLMKDTMVKELKIVTYGQLKYFFCKTMALLFGDYLLSTSESQNLAGICASALLGNVGADEFEVTLFKQRLSFCDQLPVKCRFNVRSNVFSFVYLFLMKIARKTFYFTKNRCEQRVLYLKHLWQKAIAEGLHKSGAVFVEDATNGRKLHVIPKRGGCRPVVSGFGRSEKDTMAIVATVLEVLIDRTGSSADIRLKSFPQFFESYKIFIDRNKENQLFWGTADITNCFGSVNLEKLKQRLRQLLFPERTFYVGKGLVTKNARGKVIYRAGVTRTGIQNTLQKLKARTLFIREVKTGDAYNIIINEALGQTFDFKNKKLKFSDGLLQGHPLSPVLTQFWLSLFENRIGPVTDQLFIKRYVDDYLLVGTDKTSIVKVLEYLNSQKILNWDNVKVDFEYDLCASADLIRWCGFVFDKTDNHVSIDYQRYKDKTFCYPLFPSPNQRLALSAFQRSLGYTVSYYVAIFRKCLRQSLNQNSDINRFVYFIYKAVFGRLLAKHRLETKQKNTETDETRNWKSGQIIKKGYGNGRRDWRQSDLTGVAWNVCVCMNV